MSRLSNRCGAPAPGEPETLCERKPGHEEAHASWSPVGRFTAWATDEQTRQMRDCQHAHHGCTAPHCHCLPRLPE